MIGFLGVVFSLTTFADFAPLDLPYQNLTPPREEGGIHETLRWGRPITASDFRPLFKAQTPVKNQEQRGLCSVFSALGGVESFLKKTTQKEWDLSENYLAYVVLSKIKKEADSGIRAPENFAGIRFPGIIEDNLWQYDGENWNSKSLSMIGWIYSYFTCSFSGLRQELCLALHRDPETDPFKDIAKDFAREHHTSTLS